MERFQRRFLCKRGSDFIISNVIYVSPELAKQAREIDLPTYFERLEPGQLKRISSGVYCTRAHDSLKMSNGKWYWWSRGIGGKNAIDYLVNCMGYKFQDAVLLLTGGVLHDYQPANSAEAVKQNVEKVLLLPPKNGSNDRVIEYLFGRGLDLKIIHDCISEGLIYESAKYHNAVFVGMDNGGTPRYAACRSTTGSFKGDASGSDKRYSFRLPANQPTNSVHLFEAAIDLLSYATYLKCQGRDYRAENLLSLSGVYQPQRNVRESKIPIALSQFLMENPNVNSLILHLDNDRAGRLAAAALREIMKDKLKIIDDPPLRGKDCNDFLRLYLGVPAVKTHRETVR